MDRKMLSIRTFASVFNVNWAGSWIHQFFPSKTAAETANNLAL